MAATGKKMGLTGLTTLVAVNMMGSGIIMLPSSEARLAMYERLAEEAKHDLGEDRHRRYVELYRVFVSEVGAGRLGGGRFIAHRVT